MKADSFAYVANFNSHNVSVINTGTNSVVATVAACSNNPFCSPFGVAITPKGTFAYVTNIDNVAVINTGTNTVVTTVAVGGGASRDIAITPDGAFAYVVHDSFDSVSVISTGTNTMVATVAAGSTPRGIAFTPDSAFAYVTNSDSDNVSVINTGTNTVVATVAVDSFPHGIAITPDGAFAYVTNSVSDTVSVINTGTNTVVATVAVDSFPRGIAFTPDGAFAYVTNQDSNDVSVINTGTNTVVATVAVRFAPYDIAFTPDGAFAYVTVSGSDNVSVIDTGTNTVVGTVPTCSGPICTPFGIAIKPEGTFADVPGDYWAFSFIETLAASGITAGCGGGNYCPLDPVTRAQMAVFLERGMNGSNFSPPPATGNVFLDVGAGDFAASFIEQLFADGITAGCGNNNYCPDSDVTRDQMAVFLLRAKHGSSYSPPAATGIFIDVPLSYWAVHWIEQLAAEAITAGCGGGNYCPEAQVTRDQMAVFLVRTFGL